jgi:hypothetical protein
MFLLRHNDECFLSTPGEVLIIFLIYLDFAFVHSPDELERRLLVLTWKVLGNQSGVGHGTNIALNLVGGIVHVSAENESGDFAIGFPFPVSHPLRRIGLLVDTWGNSVFINRLYLLKMGVSANS